MRRLGFYHFTALVVGIVCTAVFLYVTLGEKILDSNWSIVAAQVATFITATFFRRQLVLSKGPILWLKAVAIGSLNAALFAGLVIPVVGLLYAIPMVLMCLHIIAPLSIVAAYVMRWADRNDRYSVAALAESRREVLYA